MEEVTTSTAPKAPWYIRMAVVSAFLIFLLAGSVIYYRFITTPETNCNIVVSANRRLDQAQVVVERVTSDPSGHRRLSDVISQSNGFSVRFFLPSGTYRLKITNETGSVIFEDEEFVPPGRRLTLDLKRRFPENAPRVTSQHLTSPFARAAAATVASRS